MDALIARRTRERHERARERARFILDSLARSGFDAVIIGSLATGRFRSHSDIDILIRGRLPSTDRLKVERIVADAMRQSPVGCDLFFAEDIAEPQRSEFESAHVDASGLR
jgi:predicted nucleotidyltransferase